MKKVLIVIIMILGFNFTFSEIQVNISNNTPTKYDVILLDVSFINEKRNDYEIIGIENFNIISKNSFSRYNNSLTNNGYVKESIESDRYKIQAKKDGNFKLSVVDSNGEEKSVNIDVLTNAATIDAMENGFKVIPELNKKSYYFGEKIVYQENFIYTANISGYTPTSKNEFEDFSVINDLTYDISQSQSRKRIQYEGKPAIENIIFLGILQPNSSGVKKIITQGVQVREAATNNIVNIQPQIVDVDIKALPVDTPKNFKGIVGKITSNTEWKNTDVNVGEAITLKLTLDGKGPLDLLDTLPLTNDKNFNIFQNIIEYSENITANNQYYNKKVFEIAFVPKNNSLKSTPEIKIPYFNTESEKFENIVIPPQNIKVTGENIVENVTSVNENSNKNVNTNKASTDLKNEEKKDIPVIEETDIKVLKMEKVPAKNNYKLAFYIILILFLAQSLGLLFCIHNNKKNKK